MNLKKFLISHGFKVQVHKSDPTYLWVWTTEFDASGAEFSICIRRCPKRIYLHNGDGYHVFEPTSSIRTSDLAQLPGKINRKMKYLAKRERSTK